MARPFRLQVERSAEKEILSLPQKVRRQLEATIDKLVETLNSGNWPRGMKPLKSEPGSYRIGSGDYRVVFDLSETDRVIMIYRVRHRRDVYRNL